MVFFPHWNDRKIQNLAIPIQKKDFRYCVEWKYTLCILFFMFFILCFSWAGKTLESLTVDGEFLYWISSAKDSTQIYQAKKSSGAILSQVKAQRSRRILAYSSALQPFPGNNTVLLLSMFSQFLGSENPRMSSPGCRPKHYINCVFKIKYSYKNLC